MEENRKAGRFTDAQVEALQALSRIEPELLENLTKITPILERIATKQERWDWALATIERSAKWVAVVAGGTYAGWKFLGDTFRGVVQ